MVGYSADLQSFDITVHSVQIQMDTFAGVFGELSLGWNEFLMWNLVLPFFRWNLVLLIGRTTFHYLSFTYRQYIVDQGNGLLMGTLVATEDATFFGC